MGHARHEAGETRGDEGRGLRRVAEPDDGHDESVPVGECRQQRATLQTERLAHLTLGTVAVDGVAQPTLGDAHEELHTSG